MKPKNITYQIADPCHADWNQMTPESTGRFCDSCARSVVDFSSMPDFSIVTYLEKHTDEKVCGRFTKSQLDRVYQVNQPVFAPTFDLKALVLGLALTTFSAIHSFAQTEPQEPIRIDTTMHQVEPMILGKIAVNFYDHTKEKKVVGTVSNPESDFKNVRVVLKTNDGKLLKTVKPDAKGAFELDLDWKLNPFYIEVSGSNYETEYLSFSRVPSLSNLRIALRNRAEMIRGEIQTENH